MSITLLTAEQSTEVATAAFSPTRVLPSYRDRTHGVRVYLVDAARAESFGYAGVLADFTTDRDGLFVCVSSGLPVERRHAVVHELLVRWARAFDAARAEGGVVFEVVVR